MTAVAIRLLTASHSSADDPLPTETKERVCRAELIRQDIVALAGELEHVAPRLLTFDERWALQRIQGMRFAGV